MQSNFNSEIAITTDEGDFIVTPIVSNASLNRALPNKGIDYLRSPSSFKNIYDKPYIVSPFKNIENFNIQKPVKGNDLTSHGGYFKPENVPNILKKRRKIKPELNDMYYYEEQDQKPFVHQSVAPTMNHYNYVNKHHEIERLRNQSPPPSLTPIKPLPFSPSQFLNSPAVNLPFDDNVSSSTPVKPCSDNVSKNFIYFLKSFIYF